MADNLIKLIKKVPVDITDVLYWFDSILADIARMQYNCEPMVITNNDLYQNLHQISERLYLKKIMQLTDLINKAYTDIQGQINNQLLLENLLIKWQQCR